LDIVIDSAGVSGSMEVKVDAKSKTLPSYAEMDHFYESLVRVKANLQFYL